MQANIRPQAGSLGLQKQSLPTQANVKSAQADFVCVAATLVVRRFDKIGMHPISLQMPTKEQGFQPIKSHNLSIGEPYWSFTNDAQPNFPELF